MQHSTLNSQSVEQNQKQLTEKLRPILQSLNRLQDRVNASNSKYVAGLLQSILDTLESCSNLDQTVTAFNVTSIISTLVNLYRLREQGESLPSQVAELWLAIVHLLLARTKWKNYLGPQELQQYIVYFTLNINPTPFNAESKTTTSEELKEMAVSCISAILPAKLGEGRILDETYEVAFGEREKFWKDIMALRDDGFWLPLNHCLNVLRNLAVQDQKLQVRLLAIQTLSQLTLDNLMKIDILASVMAGITSGLGKIIIQHGEKEHHQIMVTAIEFLGDFISAVMNDEDNFEFIPRVTSLKDLWEQDKVEFMASENKLEDQANPPTESTGEDKSKTSQKVKRTQGWHAYTKTRIRDLIANVLKMRQHPDWHTRLAFANLAYTICLKCPMSLDSSIPMLVETLVLYVEDDYPQVAQITKQHLKGLSESSEFQGSLMPLIKEKLSQWLVALPRYITAGNEKEKRNAISMVTGFITLLGPELQISLDLNFPKVIDSWLNMLEYDSSDLRIVEDRGDAARFQDLQEPGMDQAQRSTLQLNYQQIHFKHLHTESIIRHLSHMLQRMGKFGDIRALSDIFMFNFFDGLNPSWQPQCAFIVGQLLAGQVEKDKKYQPVTARVAKSVLQQFLEIDLAQIENMQQGKHKALMRYKPQQHTLTSNVYSTTTIITVCNCLQTVGISLGLLTQQEVRSQLITALYPLLSYYGSTNLHIHTFAATTLEIIARICEYDEVKGLIMNNIDYVINEISLRLPSLLNNLSLPQVLQALVKLGGMGAVKYLDDSIEEIFEALDRYHMNQEICKDLCGVLTEIVLAMERDHILRQPDIVMADDKDSSSHISLEVLEYIRQKTANQSEAESDMGKDPTTMEDIGNYFLEQQRLKEMETMDEEAVEMKLGAQDISEKDLQDLEDMARSDAEKRQKEKEELPAPATPQQNRILEILRKTHHFLTAPQPHLRSQILLLMTAAIPVLADNTSELFPIIHTLWPSIVRRLDDNEHYVVMNAISLLQTLAELCSDFLTQRVVKDVWPKFRRFLDQTTKDQRSGHQVHISTSNSSYSVYSKEHRMICSILNTLNEFAIHVPIKHVTLIEIVNSSRWYLSDVGWHPQVQDTGVTLFRSLYNRYPDTTWLYCLGQVGSKSLIDMMQDPLFTANLAFTKIPQWFEQEADTVYVRNTSRILCA
ncbi:hypothetical protein INT43_007997 [Umbelopsis isabellina]|uniref:Uncharacterized protein n=1 Tax=Mortierella isabellina TaxID=91625 RepID=A0A8H7PP44_MORIS|nr:hypothetical protein INT43_007997 [Umbelopsis isabellina]